MLNDFKLTSCKDSLVGGSIMQGISGGQKNRTAIAFGLVTDPKVILLDEPASGLDSLSAFWIVQYLHKLAKNKGKTVVIVVHQPSQEIVDKMDKLILMVNGNIVFRDFPDRVTSYFQRFGYPLPRLSNQTDFCLRIMHDCINDEEKCQSLIKYYEQKYCYSLINRSE